MIPILLLLVSWCPLVALVLAVVLAPLDPILLLLTVWCWLVALVLAVVLAPPAPLLLLLAVWCWLVALVLAVVLAPPAPLLQCIFAQCWMIAPNSHEKIGMPLCLMKSLGLILQPAPHLLLHMVLTHDLNSKNQ